MVKPMQNALLGVLGGEMFFEVTEAIEKGLEAGMTEIDPITDKIICAAIRVHRELGPGLLESTYEACLIHELINFALDCKRQVELPVIYRGVHIDCGYRLDLLVENKVIVELKAVEKILPIHRAQLLSYLKLSGQKTGLLINFNVELLKSGIVRISN